MISGFFKLAAIAVLGVSSITASQPAWDASIKQSSTYFPNSEILDPDEMLEGIRKVYDDPLTIAVDLTVWNVTKDTITK